MNARRYILLAGLLGILIGLAITIQQNRVPETNDSTGMEAAPENVTCHSFSVFWPLRVAADEVTPDTRPLLLGQLRAVVDDGDAAAPLLRIQLRLTRPASEKQRAFWNDCLEYRQYAWMRRVRVWDEDQRWLYPNLAYLFKLHGIDRVRRYGGWDPGHDVDNDFGAVLIRTFNESGKVELSSTRDEPLVSADWHPLGVEDWNRQTVVHQVRSDEFVLHLRRGDSGRAKVWFVYADFMEHALPEDWPEEREFNGGTIGFFHVDWDAGGGQRPQVAITQQVPVHSGFDWKAWVGRTEKSADPQGVPKLAD